MQEELVSFQVAELAKEKGFNFIDVSGYYHVCDGYTIGYAFCFSNVNEQSEKGILAPTQPLLQRWLREIKQVEIVVSPRNKDKGMFYGCSVLTDDLHTSVGSEFKSYEEALEKGLMFALKLLK